MKKIMNWSILMLMVISALVLTTSCGGDDADDPIDNPGGNGGSGGSQPTSIIGEWWCMIDSKTGK